MTDISTLKIIDFDPFTAGEQDWEAYFDFMISVTEEQSEFGQFRIWLTNRAKEKNYLYKLVYDRNVLIASMEFALKKRNDDGVIASVVIDCGLVKLPEKFTVLLSGTLTRFSDVHSSDIFRITVTNPAIQEIMVSMGARLCNTLNFYEFSRQGVNQNLLNHWILGNSPTRLGLLVDRHDYVPENLYGPFASLMTELMNDIAREDSSEKFIETPEGVKNKMEQFRKNNVKMLTFLLSDPPRKIDWYVDIAAQSRFGGC
ncbi:MAG TPA: hypothetical protein VIM89_10260 [Mucilaginibacter sp.]